MTLRYVGRRKAVVDMAVKLPEYWTPPRYLEDQEVVIIGGGPSHVTFDLARLRGRRFIVVNSACRRVREIASPDDMLFFHDNSWAENRPELVADWPGPVVTSNRNAVARLGNAVRWIDMTYFTNYFRVLPDYLGASSGHTAVCLAVMMGAVKVVLIGFECHMNSGRSHGHADYSHHDGGLYAGQFLPGWKGLASALEKFDVEIVNATPDSAIPYFPFEEL